MKLRVSNYSSNGEEGNQALILWCPGCQELPSFTLATLLTLTVDKQFI